MLYSTETIDEGSEKYDLLLTLTGGFNPTPRVLAAPLDAALSRDAFRADDKLVAYLTGVNAGAGLLPIRSTASNEERSAPGVGTVAAGRGGVFVFSDNLSAPDIYPATASLNVWNAALAGPPQQLEAKVIDRRNVFVAPGGRAVLYSRPAAPQHENVAGIWVAALP
ncbi:MAG TPA: hypothetical protein VFS43_27585 [Polyangiaceae bacterium]|nr:hypothetical protein [Polyangiaceae bacterium]